MSQRIIYSGEAGTFWTNNTGQPQYQFIAALENTCGACLQYHLQISRAWAIPFGCGCLSIQRQIRPGETARYPFCDFRKILHEMDYAGKERAIGLANYRLLSAGLAAWEDIVVWDKVISLPYVMRRKKLTVQQVIASGVDRASAEEAWAIIAREEAARPKLPPIPALRELTAEELSDAELQRLTDERVVAALGRVDAAKVTARIVRDAEGRPSAHFSCPAHLREKLRRYIESIQSP
jgi:hypothetical protein